LNDYEIEPTQSTVSSTQLPFSSQNANNYMMRERIDQTQNREQNRFLNIADFNRLVMRLKRTAVSIQNVGVKLTLELLTKEELTDENVNANGRLCKGVKGPAKRLLDIERFT
jgi:hypothetical protein